MSYSIGPSPRPPPKVTGPPKIQEYIIDLEMGPIQVNHLKDLDNNRNGTCFPLFFFLQCLHSTFLILKSFFVETWDLMKTHALVCSV